MPDPQCAADVLMIRPVRFEGNPQTAASNAFQAGVSGSLSAQEQALAEFEGLRSALSEAGVRVHVFDDTQEPHKPDSIFPNNWVSFHADGTAVLYPMLAENRRLERRMDLLESLSMQHGFRITRVIDLSHHERDGRFLEGTGSLVLDRVNRVAYACVSARTDLDVLGDFAQQLDYDVVAFEAFDPNGAPIYHTNVMMSVGTSFAVVCSASIRDDERGGVLDALRSSGRTIVDLDFEQMLGFAGNLLELRSEAGRQVVAISQRAFEVLRPEQREILQREGSIVPAAIPTIETLGGGSVRCMLAEVFLPRK
jgi:hypothetical protein